MCRRRFLCAEIGRSFIAPCICYCWCCCKWCDTILPFQLAESIAFGFSNFAMAFHRPFVAISFDWMHRRIEYLVYIFFVLFVFLKANLKSFSFPRIGREQEHEKGEIEEKTTVQVTEFVWFVATLHMYAQTHTHSTALQLHFAVCFLVFGNFSFYLQAIHVIFILLFYFLWVDPMLQRRRLFDRKYNIALTAVAFGLRCEEASPQ